ncbi:hypothetical protein BT93_H0193 [Corymbia citriodora subsp. variegata]|nr:hypothetical protein BT93_H0193 [Corymbia citriodora subsp. variegata]
MFLPDLGRLLDRRLGQEDVDEGGHEGDEQGEEDEEAKLHVAEHGGEGLYDHEGEEHVEAHDNALSSRPDLHGEYLARHQPPQRPPREGEGRHEDTDADHQGDRVPSVEAVPLACHAGLPADQGRHCHLHNHNHFR